MRRQESDPTSTCRYGVPLPRFNLFPTSMYLSLLSSISLSLSTKPSFYDVPPFYHLKHGYHLCNNNMLTKWTIKRVSSSRRRSSQIVAFHSLPFALFQMARFHRMENLFMWIVWYLGYLVKPWERCRGKDHTEFE